MQTAHEWSDPMNIILVAYTRERNYWESGKLIVCIRNLKEVDVTNLLECAEIQREGTQIRYNKLRLRSHSIRNGHYFRSVFRFCITCQLCISCLFIKGWSIFIIRQSKPIYVKSILVWKHFFQRYDDDSRNMIVLSYW